MTAGSLFSSLPLDVIMTSNSSKRYSSSTTVVIDNIPEWISLAEEIASRYRVRTFRVSRVGNLAYIFAEFPGKRSAFKFEKLTMTFGKFLKNSCEG